MGRKIGWKVLLNVCLMISLVMALTVIHVPASEAKIKLTLAHCEPPNGVPDKAFKWWADEVEKRTGGEVKITIYGAGTLAVPPEMLVATQKGVVDIGSITWPTFFPKNFPLHTMKVGAVAFRHKALALWMAGNTVDEEIPEMRAEWTQNKLVRLATYGIASVDLITKKPIRTLADAKGLKIRATGRLNTTLLNAIGAVVVTIRSAEAYDAMQKGIVEGSVCDPSWANRYKFPEVAKYYTRVGFGGDPTLGMAMNIDTWNKLPENVKKVLIDLRTEFVLHLAEMLKKDIDTVARASFEKQKVEIIELPEKDLEKWKNVPEVKNIGEDWIQWAVKNSKIPESRLREIVKQYTDTIDEMEKRYPENW